MNFQQAKQRAENLSPANVSKALFNEIRRIEQDFFNLNIGQIEESEDSFGEILNNKDKRFGGVYTEATEEIAKLENPVAPKKAGEPYNFLWTGDFLSGFELTISGETASLKSTGTGSGDKKAFFDGYENLFGLTDESLNRVISEKLLPFFIQYYRNELT